MMGACSRQVADNWTNFTTYGLQRPAGLIRADAHRPPFRDNLHEVAALTASPHLAYMHA